MNPLREPLSSEQMALLRVIFGPFDASGQWPYWQYADLTLDGREIDAAATLASLPVAGQRGVTSRNYGLIWHQDSYRPPQPDTPVALTVAGLRFLPEAEPIIGAFFATLRYLIGQQRELVPKPRDVVEATVMSTAIADQLLTASIAGSSAPPVDMTLAKLREMIGHEPPLYSTVSHHPSEWSVRVPARLRDYCDVTTVDEYLDQVVRSVTPEQPPVPVSSEPPDVPTAVGYLDAVWASRTGSHLFVNLDPASVARLMRPCDSEDDFNSRMSALADVLAQVVEPGKVKPPDRVALEKIGDYLTAALDPAAADRVRDAIGILIGLRKIRVGGQHADARPKAVKAFGESGLAFPPPSWAHAWTHVAWLAKGALDVIREEVHAGIPQP